VSTPLQASFFSSYLLNVLLQIANKNGIKIKKLVGTVGDVNEFSNFMMSELAN
jgi:hypothetical protein